MSKWYVWMLSSVCTLHEPHLPGSKSIHNENSQAKIAENNHLNFAINTKSASNVIVRWGRSATAKIKNEIGEFRCGSNVQLKMALNALISISSNRFVCCACLFPSMWACFLSQLLLSLTVNCHTHYSSVWNTSTWSEVFSSKITFRFAFFDSVYIFVLGRNPLYTWITN